jgi:hypothetical protein
MPELTWKAPLLALSGLLFFVISIALIHPKLTENLTFHASNYWQFYRNLGDTPLKILGSFILNPAAVAHKLFTMNNLIFLAGVFGPVGVIALLTPLVLLTALPLFLQHLLSAFPGQQSLDYYYASTLAVFVFIAAVHSFARIEQQQRNRLLILIMSALFIFDLIHLTPLSRFLPSRNRDARLRHELLSRIPKDAGVIASYSFLPFLSQRKDLFVAGRKIISFTRESQRIPDSVRFALVDFSDFTQDKMAIYRLIQDPQWSMDTLIDDVALLKKTVSSEEKTILIQKKPFIIQRTSLRRTPFLLLEAIDIPSVISRGTSDLPVIFYWKTLERIPGARTVTLRIFQEGKQVFFKMLPISNGLPFRKDRYIKNLYNYSIPPLNPGNYEIEISFNAIFPSEPVRRTLTVK